MLNISADFYVYNYFFMFGFTEDFVIVTEEYQIYNFITILSAIGGSLGMFIGWSLFGSFKKTLNWFTVKAQAEV